MRRLPLLIVGIVTLMGLWATPPSAWSFQYHATVSTRTVFHASVPAEVWQYSSSGLRLLGRAGDSITLDIPTGVEGNLTFLLRRPGYSDVTLEVSAADLRHGVVPPDGSEVVMTPVTPWVPVLDFAVLHQTVLMATVGSVVGLLLFGVLPYKRRLRRRLRQIHRLISVEEKQADENVGKYIGKYLLTRLLGRGGAASVYAAVPADNLETSDPVAIKLLYNAKITPEFKSRFAREVSICKALNHPSLVRILDWEQGDLNYMVMELVQGQALRHCVPRHGLSLPDSFRILREIFAGLQYAHAQGVVHCDLKPENIMITPTGGVRVMDFGISTGHNYERLTQTTDVLGTPGYVAPEQLDGVRNDPRSDQYALGVIIFEMLTGQAMYDTADPIVRISRQLTEAPRRITEVRPDVPDALSDVVVRMLSLSPQDRYRDLGTAWGELIGAAGLDQDPSYGQRTMRISLSEDRDQRPG